MAEGRPQLEIVPTTGHSSTIHSVAWSPDGARVISASADKSIKLWDIATGRLLRTFHGHTGVVRAVAFSPDGTAILSGSYDGTVRLWDPKTGQLLRIFHDPYASRISSISFAPNGAQFLASSKSDVSPQPEDTIMLWDIKTGQLLRTFNGHSAGVNAVRFSPDGRLLASVSDDRTLKLWNAASGNLLRTIIPFGENETFDRVLSVAFSPDGTRILTGRLFWGHVKLWDVATGAQLKSFESKALDGVWQVAFSPDGTRVAVCGKSAEVWDAVSGRTLANVAKSGLACALSGDGKKILIGEEMKNSLLIFDWETGTSVSTFQGHNAAVSAVAASPDGEFVYTGGWEPNLKVWSPQGRLLRSIKAFSSSIFSLSVAADGRRVLMGGANGALALIDSVTGEVVRHFGVVSLPPGPPPDDPTIILAPAWLEPDVTAVALSGDGSRALSAEFGNHVKLWDVSTGALLHSWEHPYFVNGAAFSPDGSRVVSGCLSNGRNEETDRTLRLWDTLTGRPVHDFGGHSQSVSAVAYSPIGDRIATGDFDGAITFWDAKSATRIETSREHSSLVRRLVYSKDGQRLLSGSADGTVILWNTATQQVLRRMAGNSGSVFSVAFSHDESRILSAGPDSNIRLWDAASGQLLAAFSSARDGTSIAIAPEGFFDASSPNSAERLSIVRGYEVTGADQVYQSLFAPDLLREKIAGDPDKEVERAAKITNLEQVLDSGPAPKVVLLNTQSVSQTQTEVMTLEAQVSDQGKGIGRIEWRVNGISAGVSNLPDGESQPAAVKQSVALDPGENTIEVVAYNKRNLLASQPARTTITLMSKADAARPKLHVLAIGINAYLDKGFLDPATGRSAMFKPLSFAVKDAEAFGGLIKAAAKDIYESVDVTLALDAGASAAGLEKIVNEVAAKVGPRDTFVLYAAAHGYSIGGRFYLIPQDYQSDGSDLGQSLRRHAIGQERLQDWMVNRIKAKKALVLLDTCASGALVADYSVSRIDVPASEAAIGRLHEATGRPILTAAAGGKEALEGVGEPGRKHGVFTYAVMEAFSQGDTNGNGKIELSELVAYVQKRVPEISSTIKLKNKGPITQKPKLGSRGEDFVIAGRLK